MTTDSPKPPSCPCCGAEAMTNRAPMRSRVSCECGLEAPDAAAWNRRPDRSPAGEVRVKPLVWEDHGCGIWSAASDALDLSLYQISFEADAAFELDWFGDREPAMFPTLEAAKAAAQADYERRILAALEPAPGVEGLLSALRFYSSYDGWEDYDPAGCDRTIIEDGGDIARAALAAYEESQK